MMGIYAGMVQSFGRPITLRRYAAPARNVTTGRSSSAPLSDQTIIAATYPATGEQKRDLPEGRRTETILAVHTKDEIKTTQAPGGAQADRFVVDTVVYEAITVKPWGVNDGWEVMAAKVSQ